MSVLVVGLSHRTASVALLERTALDAAASAKLAEDVTWAEHVAEAVVLATCNRLEVYAEVDRFHDGVAEVSELLARHTGVDLETLTPHLYVHYEERAVQHVFAVSCGLDSMVVGEAQILGQVRAALRAAQEAGTAGRVLNELLQQALRVGKRAHAETGIDAAGPSLVGVGLELAETTLGGLAGRSALVIGAGSMSSLAALTLRRAGIGELVIANRTAEHAARLAASAGGSALLLGEVDAALARADVVVSCTGAVGTVLGRDQIVAARRGRGDGGRQFVLDLALPHDVDPAVRDVDGVTLVDLERLGAALEGHQRSVDLEAVRRIVADEVGVFLGWQRSASVAPTVAALRARASEVVDGELARLAGRLPDLDPHARAEVAAAVRRVVDKLLHAPTVRVKQLAGAPGGSSYAAVLRELFDLDPALVRAVTALDAPAHRQPASSAGPPAEASTDSSEDPPAGRRTGGPVGGSR